MNVVFDGNYLFLKSYSIWSTYHKGKDMCEVLSDKENCQQLIRKTIIDMCATLNRFKDVKKVVIVFDSKSWRYKVHEDYKYKTTRVQEPYKAKMFAVMDEFESLLKSKGFITSRVDGAEGDDLMLMWSIYFEHILDEHCICVTGDSDIRQIITPKVTIFNNNSKKLDCYCHPKNEKFFNDYFDIDITVNPTSAIESTIYKVVMGDSSDNIFKLKHGFGDKAFEKFIKTLDLSKINKNTDFSNMAHYICDNFCNFIKSDEKEDYFDKIIFNLKMVWLNTYVYEGGFENIAFNIINNIKDNKDNYTYNNKFSLENIYGMLIK
jgi:5'-3' exonuclease